MLSLFGHWSANSLILKSHSSLLLDHPLQR
jgi:hypothetical protein